MNILHLSPSVPSVKASHAGGIGMGKEVEELKKRHNVTVLTFCNDKYEEILLKEHPDYLYVKTNKLIFILNALTHLSQPLLFGIRQDRRYKKLLCKVIEEKQIDAIHAEYTSMGQFWWIKNKYPNIKFNLVEHDVTYQLYERQYNKAIGLKKLYLSFEKNKVKKKEKECLKNVDSIITFNDKDVNLIKKYYNLENVVRINPYYGLDFNVNNNNVVKQERSVCYVGQMGREENHIAAMRLIRIIEKMNDESIKLNIIGAHPKKELLDNHLPNVKVMGFVEDINEEILKNKIAVFPLTQGAGIKFKVLLSLGLGLPVITTDVGAEGIDEEGRVVMLAKSDEEFINHIKELLDNDDLYEEKTKSSIEYVKERFGWDKTVDEFKQLYKG